MTSRHFDQAAATWDANPVRRELVRAISKAILSSVPLQPRWSVLEYGCGTASLSVALCGAVQRIVAADSSPGMLTEVRRKLAEEKIDKIAPMQLDLTRDEPPDARFDLITCAMAFHHVGDVDRLLRAFAAMQDSGGWLAVADLCAEDGSFHADMTVPHNGFDPDRLVARVTEAGFTDGESRTVHVMHKSERSYPIFLLTARRK